MKIIVGLGNTGDKYNNTRHNVGFMVLDKFARENNLSWKLHKKFKAELAECSGALLVKPQTYMNLSGESVRSILHFYKILNDDLPESLVVIHDDMDIDFGKYKIALDSRSAGHNGVQSIIDHLGTKNFQRIRIGIRTEEKEKIPTEKFVLQKFSKEELGKIDKLNEEIIKKL